MIPTHPYTGMSHFPFLHNTVEHKHHHRYHKTSNYFVSSLRYTAQVIRPPVTIPFHPHPRCISWSISPDYCRPVYRWSSSSSSLFSYCILLKILTPQVMYSNLPHPFSISISRQGSLTTSLEITRWWPLHIIFLKKKKDRKKWRENRKWWAQVSMLLVFVIAF